MSKSPIEDLQEEKQKAEGIIEQVLNQLTNKCRHVKDELGFEEGAIAVELKSGKDLPQDWSAEIDIEFLMQSDN